MTFNRDLGDESEPRDAPDASELLEDLACDCDFCCGHLKVGQPLGELLYPPPRVTSNKLHRWPAELHELLAAGLIRPVLVDADGITGQIPLD